MGEGRIAYPKAEGRPFRGKSGPPFGMSARDQCSSPLTTGSSLNWCCGGGGGASAIEEGEALRLEAFKKKKSQFEAVKPDRVVTACANCRIVLEESLEHYQMELPVIGLTELIAEHIPDNAPQAAIKS